ncbi:hypothetical protein I4U23_012334 [Adineta vaga]|nr:hypothetical protein I4U23_012334 [Adineta vaga]
MDYYRLDWEDKPFIIGDLYDLIDRNRPKELDTYLRDKPYAQLSLTVVEERNDEEISLLILATLYGYVDIVRILLNYNSTNEQVELKGCVYSIDGDFVKDATALWCALHHGHYDIARILIEVGLADVNYGPYGPLLIDAIDTKQHSIVQFLVENDYADINLTVNSNDEKESCLMIAVRCGDIKTVVYLCTKGAKVGYRTPLTQNSAMSYAAEHGFMDVVQYLYVKGASPTNENRLKKTPLLLATENGHLQVINFLLQFDHTESTMNELELIASKFIMTDQGVWCADVENGVKLFRQLLKQRILYNIPKNIAEPIAVYEFQQECQTVDELDQIQQNDSLSLYRQGLLIRERILLPRKDPTLLEPLLEQNIELIEDGIYYFALTLCHHIFDLQQSMELDVKLDDFILIFCQMLNDDVFIPGDEFLKACRLVFTPSQRQSNDDCLRNTLHLVTIAVEVLRQSMLDSTDRKLIVHWMIEVFRQQWTTSTGQTLLHLSVDSEIYQEIRYKPLAIRKILIYPNIHTVRLLLIYGQPWIDLNAVELVKYDTALHIISRHWNLFENNVNSSAIVEMLINSGAHVDCVNRDNQTPLNGAMDTDICTLLKSKQIPPRLKCLCARLVNEENLLDSHLSQQVGNALIKFVQLHGGLTTNNHYSSDLQYERSYFSDDYISD